MTTLTEALARGLFDRDRHEWGGNADGWESLRPHYVRDAERFLLPHLTDPTHTRAPRAADTPPDVAGEET